MTVVIKRSSYEATNDFISGLREILDGDTRNNSDLLSHSPPRFSDIYGGSAFDTITEVDIPKILTDVDHRINMYATSRDTKRLKLLHRFLNSHSRQYDYLRCCYSGNTFDKKTINEDKEHHLKMIRRGVSYLYTRYIIK